MCYSLRYVSFPAHPIRISNLKIWLVHYGFGVSNNSSNIILASRKKKKKWGETTIKFQMRKRKAITATVWNVHESTQSDWPRAWIIISIICLPFLRGSCNHERVCTKVPISFLLHFLLLIKVKQKYYISLKFNWNNNWISCRTFCCCCCCL